jgi:ATP dependent DNA ligase domain
MHWHIPGPVRRPPGFIESCLPTNGYATPIGPHWAYEIKHDGFRFICRRDGDRVRVFSRRGHDWTDRVPRIADALTALRVKSVTIDGEGVVCGRDGVTDFNLMRVAVGRKGSRKAFLYAFDLLELDGVDLGRELWDADNLPAYPCYDCVVTGRLSDGARSNKPARVYRGAWRSGGVAGAGAGAATGDAGGRISQQPFG